MESVRPSVATVYEQVTARLAILDGLGLVRELRSQLGAWPVAYLVGESSTSAVTGYITDAATIPDAAHTRLEAAYTVAARQYQLGATPSLIQAWFQGRNPRLNDQTPGKVIAEDPARDRDTLIVAAITLASS